MQTGDIEAGFNAGSFWFGEEGRRFLIPVMYRKKKGDKYTKGYSEIAIDVKFCPFTGKPLYQDSLKSTAADE